MPALSQVILNKKDIQKSSRKMRHHEKMSKPHKTLTDQVEIAENNIDLDLLLSELVIDYENNKKIKY